MSTRRVPLVFRAGLLGWAAAIASWGCASQGDSAHSRSPGREIRVGTSVEDDRLTFLVASFTTTRHHPQPSSGSAGHHRVRAEIDYWNNGDQASRFSCPAVRQGDGVELVVAGDVSEKLKPESVRGTPACEKPIQPGANAQLLVTWELSADAAVEGLYLFNPSGDDPDEGGTVLSVDFAD
jgi:hypothetical protein